MAKLVIGGSVGAGAEAATTGAEVGARSLVGAVWDFFSALAALAAAFSAALAAAFAPAATFCSVSAAGGATSVTAATGAAVSVFAGAAATGVGVGAALAATLGVGASSICMKKPSFFLPNNFLNMVNYLYLLHITYRKSQGSVLIRVVLSMV